MTCLIRSTGITFTEVTSYASKADFIDEVRVIPPLKKALSDRTVAPTSSRTTSYFYDAEGRLVRAESFAGATTSVYTAWDAAGRPTAGGGDTDQRTTVYDDVARASTETLVGLNVIYIRVFDANGNPLSLTRKAFRDPGMTEEILVNDASTYETTATARVCK